MNDKLSKYLKGVVDEALKPKPQDQPQEETKEQEQKTDE